MPPEIPWSDQSAFPILSALVFLPLLTMNAAMYSRGPRQPYLLGILGSGLELALAIHLLGNFDTANAGLQFAERFALLPFLDWHLGVNGLNILFIAATGLLGFLLSLYGSIVGRQPANRYVACLCGLQAVLMGLFCAADLLLFWLLAVLEPIPAALLSHQWGTGRERGRATRRYLHFMVSGVGLVLIGILILGWSHAEIAGDWSFDADALLATPLPPTLQTFAFVFMFYGLAVRMAQFPFHAWLPDLAQHGTLATVLVFLLGAKVGMYALFRFVLPLLPDAAHGFQPLVLGLGLAGMFYGAFLAMMQLNLRRLLAFAAVSHTGMLVIGIFSLNHEGLAGSLILTINFGLATGGLLFASGLMLHRAGSALLPRLGGLLDLMPLRGLSFLVAALSTMAMPGTPGFDAVHLMLEGVIAAHRWSTAIAVATGNVLAAAFLLWAFQRAFLAQRRAGAIRVAVQKLTLREAVLTGIICAVLLGMGFYSEPWLAMVDAPVVELAERVRGGK